MRHRITLWTAAALVGLVGAAQAHAQQADSAKAAAKASAAARAEPGKAAKPAKYGVKSPRDAATGMASGKRMMGSGNAEAAIREIDRKWVAAIAAKDTAYIRSIHAADAADLPPNGKMAEGRDAVVAMWAGFANMPGLELDFSGKDFIVSASGDLAVETGTWRMKADDPKNAGGKMGDDGKFVVVWKKVGGDWKVVRDIWNSDHPMPGM